MTYILTRPDFGHNTFNIANAMENCKRVKSDEPIPNDDWCIRWGCTANVPGKPKIINKSSAIHEVYAKGLFRKKVGNAGHAPKTWDSAGDFAYDVTFGDYQFSSVIIRPVFHQRSEDLYFCTTIPEVKAAVDKINGPYYISEYIAKDREFRAFVANGRLLIMAEKIPKDRKEITWGCVEDGILDYIFWSDWDKAVAQCAIEAFNLSSLDFAAIDIMMKDGKAYFLEANTAPEVFAYYGKTLAKAFTYMIETPDGRKRIPVKSYDNWKNYIHPCMTKEAQ